MAIPATATLVGAVVAAVFNYRAASETARAEAQQASMSASDTLINQLQEELTRYREDADRRATAQDERMNRLESNSDGYRTYAHELRAHIFDGLGPPAPAWPDGLPR
ncbi:hypothetical protein M2390_002917 [Mycetocola sp. BIGb0189]|uniref:hypothetical protein n=1 Tax=Mycetocola sp. BIGb0189 TaxID=2940604 RepID=UPI002169B6AB|nr:hypothetical protein [Mycetocola sp. BIGb0189]MCS4277708.1 hypothetical protein [Mycetocola sp. BIGb0189]